MKKNLLALALILAGMGLVAQSQRLSLYEEFTGETCPPCASTNPGLNVKLKANEPKIVAIKWQVPIPSAPSKTWSLYQTNKTEIDWRWRGLSYPGYGYSPAINSAPSSKIDGQEATVFGASSGHPANLNNTVIYNAYSVPASFDITMLRDWNRDCSAITVTVNIKATQNFSAVGNLVFRCVMVERLIQFSVQPGTNGEKDFEDVAIKSFPTLQSGTSLPANWTNGQTQTFTLNCTIPSYTRKKEQIAFVGFIQDDGNQQVAQAARAGTVALPANQITAAGAEVEVTCDNMITPQITVVNNGQVPVTSITVTPYKDNVAAADLTWTGNLAVGASTTIAFSPIATSTVVGAHTFSFNITNINNAAQFNITKNASKVSYLVASQYQGTPVVEGFLTAAFPPAVWTSKNSDGGPNWTRVTNAGAYNIAPMNSIKYDFYNNPVIGDKDELYLPPMDLSGGNSAYMTFDIAYAPRLTGTSDDRLEVFASDDCGETWTNLYSQSGVALSTIQTPYQFEYVPDNASLPDAHWRTDQVFLNNFNKPNVLVKFVTTNDNGNSLYLDNINLVQTDPVGIAKASNDAVSAVVFPNPSNGLATIRITSSTAARANVSVVNTLGQTVYTRDAAIETGVNNIQVDMKEFASGIYTVLIDSDKGTTVKKLTIAK
jgi:hypothetical protein